MPIKGLFDDRGLGAGLPRIAQLKKGGLVPNAKGNGEHPVDLDYFRVVFEPQYEHLQPIWEEIYGKEPTEFENVFLIGQTVDDTFEYWREEWNTSGTLLHRCDGEEQHVWMHPELFMMMNARIKCAAPTCQCKATGRLKMVFPDFLTEAQVYGYISASTGSLRDIATVYLYLRDMEKTMGGNLARIPFRFGRAPEQVNVPKQEKRNGEYVTTGRMKTTKAMFYIDVMPDVAVTRIIPLLTGAIEPPAPLPAGPNVPEITAEAGAKLLAPGNGHSRRMGVVPETVIAKAVLEVEPEETAPAKRWTGKPLSAADLHTFFARAENNLTLSKGDVKRLLGLENIEDLAEWEQKFSTMKEAGDLLMAAHNSELEHAQHAAAQAPAEGTDRGITPPEPPIIIDDAVYEESVTVPQDAPKEPTATEALFGNIFTVTGFSTRMEDVNGKADQIVYWLTTLEGQRVKAFGRDVFRKAGGYKDKEMTNWNKPGKELVLPDPFKIEAVERQDHVTKELYWSYSKPSEDVPL